MKEPRYTDRHRYPNGWVKSTETDVRATFDRVRKQQEAAKAKTIPIRKSR